jgi:spore maturation protein SpmA
MWLIVDRIASAAVVLAALPRALAPIARALSPDMQDNFFPILRVSLEIF